jgi:SAM-dependent methyltransferase
VLKSHLYRVFERFARALGIPDVQSRLDQIEIRQKDFEVSQANLFQGLLEQSENAKNVIPMIQTVDRLNETRTRKLILDAKLEQEHQLMTQVGKLIDDALVQLRRDLDGIRAMVGTSGQVSRSLVDAQVVEPQNIDDALYVSLEDRFRGDKATVIERQSEYLQYVVSVATSNSPVLDLGCGRGEWLQLLRQEGIPSHGVDGNDAAVAECLNLGLDVKHSELLTALKETSSQSIGAVTMFQVLEHLPFNVVIDVLRESLRVLIPGGVFIGEIPNCETLRVGASTFWIDPTHQRPLYPAVLEFLASQVGYKSVEGRYSSPLSPPLELNEVPEEISSVLRELHYRVNGPGDFAIIAKA